MLTSRVAAEMPPKGRLCVHMPHEGAYVQPCRVVHGPVAIADCRDLAPLKLYQLGGPSPHVAKALQHGVCVKLCSLSAVYFMAASRAA